MAMHVAMSLGLLLAVNAGTVAAFATDKRRSVAGGWRIRESTLLWLALLGGSPGALWARRRYRHKTRKQPFSATLDGIVMVQAGAIAGLLLAFAL